MLMEETRPQDSGIILQIVKKEVLQYFRRELDMKVAFKMVFFMEMERYCINREHRLTRYYRVDDQRMRQGISR